MQIETNTCTLAEIPRSRSTRYEDHQGLVTKLAMKYFTRVKRAKIPGVDFEDVKGELGIAFTQAAAGYDIAAGFSFTAFFGRCAQNHVNKWLGRLCKEQYGDPLPDEDKVELQHNAGKGLGYVSIEDLADSGQSMIEMSDGSPTQFDRVHAIQRLSEIVADASLMPETRAYIATMVHPAMLTPAVAERIEAQSSRVKLQIEQRFGVTYGRSSLL